MPSNYGRVNQYVARDAKLGTTSHIFFTVNLAHGATPFMVTFFTDKEAVSAQSTACRLTLSIVTVTHGFYRPGLEEFLKLDADHKTHVLKGGLLLAPLRDAVRRQCKDDDLPDGHNFETWKAFCERVYNVTPPVWETPDAKAG